MNIAGFALILFLYGPHPVYLGTYESLDACNYASEAVMEGMVYEGDAVEGLCIPTNGLTGE